MPNTKPLVCVACVCEKVLYERDGVLSAIRIVDVLYVPAQNRPSDLSDVALSVPGVSLNILVSLKSGDLKGYFHWRRAGRESPRCFRFGNQNKRGIRTILVRCLLEWRSANQHPVQTG